jgi:hypothetical protein
MTVQIAVPMSGISKTLIRSPVIDEKRTLVLTCDYSDSGAYGYFVCWERKVPTGYEYTDPVHFEQKTSEVSFNEAIRVLKSTIEQHQKPGL